MLDAIPPEALTDDVAILGKKGAGKTYLARGEAEQLLDAGRRVCVIDPTGVWYGLRLAPDGRRASPYQVVIFGGDHADVSLDDASGERLADLVASGDFSAIVDTKRLTVGARTRLFTGFAERLASVNRKPIHLVIDEAHLFAPQGRVNDPASGRMLHAANNLVSGARALGVRIMLLTQRPAKLHKDTLSGVETMVAMRMVAPQDRAAVEDWIREQADPARGREIVASLPKLPTGEGWIWSPQLEVLERARFRPIRTFDSSRTPGDDEPQTTPVRLASLDLGALAAAIAAPAEDDAPAKGKRRAAARVPTGSADTAAVDAAYARGCKAGFRLAYPLAYDAGFDAAQRRAVEALGPALAALKPGVDDKHVVTAMSLLALRHPELRADGLETDTASAPPSRRSAGARPVSAPSGGGDRGATAPERVGVHPRQPPAPSSVSPGMADRLLEAARRSPVHALALDDVCILAGVSPISGPARIAKAWLVHQAHEVELDPVSSRIQAFNWRGDGPERLTRHEVVDAWRAKLGGMAAEILGFLFVHNSGTSEAAAKDLGRSPISGPWRGAWKKLRNNQLVEAVGDKRDKRWQLAAILRELPKAVEVAA